MKVTDFLYNLQQLTKKMTCKKYSKVLSELDIAAHLVYITHAKNFSMSFTAKKKSNRSRSINKNNQEEDPKQKKKNIELKIDECKKKTDKDTIRKGWVFYK